MPDSADRPSEKRSDLHTDKRSKLNAELRTFNESAARLTQVNQRWDAGLTIVSITFTGIITILGLFGTAGENSAPMLEQTSAVQTLSVESVESTTVEAETSSPSVTPPPSVRITGSKGAGTRKFVVGLLGTALVGVQAFNSAFSSRRKAIGYRQLEAESHNLLSDLEYTPHSNNDALDRIREELKALRLLASELESRD